MTAGTVEVDPKANRQGRTLRCATASTYDQRVKFRYGDNGPIECKMIAPVHRLSEGRFLDTKPENWAGEILVEVDPLLFSS